MAKKQAARRRPSPNDIGERGEAIFVVRITQPFGPAKDSVFRPKFLGEKYQTLDQIVELKGLNGRSAYFFVQVKATRKPLTKQIPPRLAVRVSRIDIDRMLGFPAPTYVVGIDEIHEQAYIVSVNGKSMGALNGLPAIHRLDQANLQRLWDEVESYWKDRDMVLAHSAFAI
jgi:hypothetical protein